MTRNHFYKFKMIENLENRLGTLIGGGPINVKYRR